MAKNVAYKGINQNLVTEAMFKEYCYDNDYCKDEAAEFYWWNEEHFSNAGFFIVDTNHNVFLNTIEVCNPKDEYYMFLPKDWVIM